jgi:hypothetical protein
MYTLDGEINGYSQIGEPAWALLNLIIVLLSVVIITLIALLAVHRQKHEKVDWVKSEDLGYADIYYKSTLMLVGFLTALAGVLTFVVTQNAESVMALADMWTVPHLILAVTGILCCRIAFKSTAVQQKNNEQGI